MIAVNLFAYSGLFNIILGFLYYLRGTSPTPESLIAGGGMNIILALILVGLIELKKRRSK